MAAVAQLDLSNSKKLDLSDGVPGVSSPALPQGHAGPACEAAVSLLVVHFPFSPAHRAVSKMEPSQFQAAALGVSAAAMRVSREVIDGGLHAAARRDRRAALNRRYP
jgi:hypothetical protein